MSNDSITILQEAQNLATLAVAYDQQKDLQAAIYFYSETVATLKKHLDVGGDVGNRSEIESKVHDYGKRLKVLQEKLSQSIKNLFVPKSDESNCSIERLEFLLREALDQDEEGDVADALPLYLEAVETGLKIKETITDEKLNSRLTFIITKALERAELLKKINTKSLERSFESKLSLNEPNQRQLSSTDPSLIGNFTSSESNLIISGNESYSKTEIEVLKRSSVINGVEYLPFMPKIDLRERFSTLSLFDDGRGLLPLSPKQKASLVEFRRLAEIAEMPCIISNPKSIDCFAIKQTVVTDCSVIASLTVSALWERRFNKKLISNIIYPQNRNQEPVYNPCGKYMVKLHINGILRKIIIDDRLPVGNYGQLLCSYSSNKNEFWVSLLEKAYMKVMGGYDFPGSNSNIDLHALTGWIPERMSFSSIEKDSLMKLLISRYDKGDVLVTFATGEFSQTEEDRTGLVPGHAYAMLDVKFVQNKRLFLLKNPWSHMRWKGRFSERDIDSWTPELQSLLHFDPKSAKNFDNGVFWIDIDSVFRFFDVCYLNWNPNLFKYSYCTHDVWNAGVGPAKDLYYIGDNPQYSLNIKNSDSSTWILLTRHIMDRNDFANNKEYIALLVYKKNGEKVYLPFDPAPYIDGARINSPHYLCKIIVNKNNPVLKYTLVISQYEKSNTILYTLRAYSTSPFSLQKIPNPYRYKEVDKNGQWTSQTAGGCRNHPLTYQQNPIYQLIFNGSSKEDDNDVMIELRGPKAFQIGLEISTVTVVNQNSPNYFKRNDSGSFRSGFTYLQLKSLPAGTYQIVPSTFNPGQIGPFFITVKSSHPIKLSRLK